MFLFPILLITYKNDLKTKPGFDNFQKQSPRAVLLKRKSVLKNVTKFKKNHLYRKLIFNKVARLKPATSSKNRPRHRFFPMNFVKFLRTTLFAEHERWLFLNFPFFNLCKNVGLNITTCLLFCLFRYLEASFL